METRRIIMTIGILILFGCGETNPHTNRSDDLTARAEPANAISPSAAPLVSTAAELVNSAGLRLYSSVADATPGRNIAVSPLAITIPLTMLYAGAAGGTAQQFESFFKWIATPTSMHQELAALVAAQKLAAAQTTPSTRFELSSQVWAAPALPLRLSYRNTLMHYYSTCPTTLDFSANPTSALKTINDWGMESSHGLLPELLPDGAIDATTRIIESSLLYFSGKWQLPFAESDTALSEFFLQNGQTVEVPTMSRADGFRYASTTQWQAAEMTYLGDRFSMLLVLPAPNEFLAVEKGLSPEFFDEITKLLTPDYVAISLPKFSVSTSTNLSAALASLGLDAAFDPDRADFSNISAAPLFVSLLQHAVTVRVTEAGTEAAAATTAVGGVTAEPILLWFNRPFFFAIRDKTSGALLFVGRVMDPSQS